MKSIRLISLLCAFALLFCSCGAAPAPTAEAPQYAYDGAPAPADSPFDGGEAATLYEDGYFWDEEDLSGEEYLSISENRVTDTAGNPLLTFSLKVDTASYNNIERYIQSGISPPTDAVRTEELINYFPYTSPMTFDRGSPFAVSAEIGPSPFDPGKQLAMVRVKARELDKSLLPSSNLVFLIDTSGSMNSYDKLPLLQKSLELFVETLRPQDRVSLVTYAGSSQILLDSVSGGEQSKIISAIGNLSAGGATAGAQGIATAYALAEENFLAGGNNRIILASDGDFNVGLSSLDELEALISQKREGGVYLSVLGFGTGNLRDSVMETLATHGNGNYVYISSLKAAQKALVDEMASNLFTVADDVKTQVEFNPAAVKNYRLIGYENRRLANEDFENDRKDAGEIGAGSDVVALFEIQLEEGASRAENLFEVRIRYKDPGEEESKLFTLPVGSGAITTDHTDDFLQAASVAIFGHLLRSSEYTGEATLPRAIALGEIAARQDESGYRRDYIALLKAYEELV